MCNTNWQNRLSIESVSLTEVISHISKLILNHQAILNRVMTRIVTDCPNLEILPARGFHPFSFHIKLPNTSKPYVWASVLLQPRNGIRIMTRIELRGYQANTNSELRWQNQITTNEDIEQVIGYLRNL